jgi:hypothetical protein
MNVTLPSTSMSALVASLHGGFVSDDDMDDLDGAKITRASYRLAASRWRRKAATERYRIRGTCDLLLLGVGIHFHGASLWVSATTEEIGVKFPARVAFRNDPPPASASFRGTHERNMFAKKAWLAVLFGFPDAEHSPIGELQLREQT